MVLWYGTVCCWSFNLRVKAGCETLQIALHIAPKLTILGWKFIPTPYPLGACGALLAPSTLGVPTHFFYKLTTGHVCRADCIQDHSRALRACLRPAKEREYMKPGWPRHADMLRTVEGDLRSFTLGLASAYRRAQNKTAWHELVETATSKNMPQMMMLMLVLANAQDAG